MADNSKEPKLNSVSPLNGDGYNKIYKYQWHTHVYAIPLTAIELMQNICEKKFGWHFIPHRNMQYEKEDWFKDQTLVISFESQTDLITSKLNITL